LQRAPGGNFSVAAARRLGRGEAGHHRVVGWLAVEGSYWSGDRARIYLDHAATSPLRPEAAQAMSEAQASGPLNPLGGHWAARAAAARLDEARERLAEAIGCAPGEIVLTSGATEADNLAVVGSEAKGPSELLCSAVEHAAVREPLRRLGGREVGVDRAGRIDLDELDDALSPSVRLVSVMAANNEVGTLQPLDEVARLVRRRARAARLHVDAVAVAGWGELAEVVRLADLVTLSAHKLGGPVGVGALVVRRGVRLQALLHGGGQERARRAGTVDVAGAAGFAAALEAAEAGRPAVAERVRALRDHLEASVRRLVPGVVVTAGAAERVGWISHVLVPGVERDELLFVLDRLGVAASAGAACASGAAERSHVLAAMGAPAAGWAPLRLSLGHATTEAEIEQAASLVAEAVALLRSTSQRTWRTSA